MGDSTPFGDHDTIVDAQLAGADAIERPPGRVGPGAPSRGVGTETRVAPRRGTAAIVDPAPGMDAALTRVEARARTTVLPQVKLVDGCHVLVATNRHRYETLALLGEGGAGRVHKVADNDIGRTVAVKRLHPDLASPGVIARFVDEIRLVGQLEHPNIVPIHDVGIDESGEYFFVMKYVEGETLETIIARLAAGDRAYHARYPFERRVEIFLGILEAVHYVHARRIVHRDLKPSNIMVGAYGEVMVMDWGIARRLDDDGTSASVSPASTSAASPAAHIHTGASAPASPSTIRQYQTQAGALVGTPLYMSPEQARGEPVDERSDVYSLCMLFYELITLVHPFASKPSVEAVLAAVMHEDVPIAALVGSRHQPTVPMDLAWFLRRGLAKSPDERFRSVAAMIQRLRDRAEGKIPIECHITLTRRVFSEMLRAIDRHPVLFTSGLLTVVALVVALVVTHLR